MLETHARITLAVASLSLWGCLPSGADEDARAGEEDAQAGGDLVEEDRGRDAGGAPADDPGPTPSSFEGALGERGDCGIPAEGAPRLEAVECVSATLSGTGHEYCVLAHPDCANEGERCPVYIMFNQGSPLGSSATFRSRVRRPHRYGKAIVVGGGTSADHDVMAELPRRVLADWPGADADRVYALGNSRGAGAINAIFEDEASAYGSTEGVYAAVAIFGGQLDLPDDYSGEGAPHALVVNGQEDKEEAGDVEQLARLSGCERPESPWRPVTSADPLMSGGDGTDIASKRSFGACPRGDAVAYRFRDEGHVLDYQKNFDPKVRAIFIAWDFFQGRSRDGGLRGEGSPCFDGE